METKGGNNNARFSVFYDEIKRFSNSQEFINAAKNTTQEEFAEEILKEAYCNSTICAKKMRRFRKGIWTVWARY